MTKRETQIARVQRMEEMLDQLVLAERAMQTALDQFEKIHAPAKKLGQYFDGAWRQDFEDDEAGLLPRDLKRGVLSEDGLWDALADYRAIILRMQDAVRNSFLKGPF